MCPPAGMTTLQLNSILNGSDFLEYEGSMTAPPCAETVTWLVRAKPLPVSSTQLKYLATGIAAMTSGQGNYREVMPLNGREVAVRQAVFTETLMPADLPAALPEDDSSEAPKPPDLPSGVLEMARKAREALRAANNASAYATHLDARLSRDQKAAAEDKMLNAAATGAVNDTAVYQAASVVAAEAAQQLTASVNANAQAAARSAAGAAIARLRGVTGPD